MLIYFIDSFIKLFGIHFCTSYTFFKITNYKDINIFIKLILLTLIIILAIFQYTIQKYFSSFIASIITFFIYSIVLSIITKIKFVFSVITTILSMTFSYISLTISIFITLLPLKIFGFFTAENPISFIIAICLSYLIIYCIFKLKRFKDGFPFLKNNINNEYINMFIIVISIITIFMYFLMGNYKEIYVKYFFVGFILFSIVTFLIIQKTFILYQKQKLLQKTLKEYEAEIKEKDEKIEHLLKEENTLVKANHEFYHRQEALRHKLMNLKENNSETFNEDYGEIINRIESLSEEYKKQIETVKILHKLPKCDISEIDDMFSYLQNECAKNNIEFILKINGNIHSLINNIIPKNKLETLIGDLIRNSIIAVNYSAKDYRSIMVILSIKDNLYEFCIFDSGIEFQKETLLKLGLEKATTHKDNGGTGIGFITTFETLQSCNASLIINEFMPNETNYTKSIIIRFDEKFKYIINSYRFSELNKISTNRDNIIINPFLEI